MEFAVDYGETKIFVSEVAIDRMYVVSARPKHIGVANILVYFHYLFSGLYSYHCKNIYYLII